MLLHLPVPSIVTGPSPIRPAEVRRLRRNESFDVRKVQRALSADGDSVIRFLSVHSDRILTIEQEIVIHVM